MVLIAILSSVLASLGLSILSISLWRRKIRRELDSDAILGRLRTEVGELITELNGTTDRNIALIESRITALNSALNQANRTAELLEREAVKRDRSDRVYTELGRSRPLSIAVDDEVKSPPPDLDIADFDALPVRDKALVLHRKGDSIESIASDLDMSRGEVELIISLHERRR